jgi:hypothetical protein
MLDVVIASIAIAYACCSCAEVAAVLRAPTFQKPTWALRPTPGNVLSFAVSSPLRRLGRAYRLLPRRRRRSLARGVTLVAASGAFAALIFALSYSAGRLVTDPAGARTVAAEQVGESGLRRVR